MTAVEPALDAAARKLAREAGLGEIIDIAPIHGGRNNRLFRVMAKSGEAAFKAYFHHPGDPRDRLATEFDFLSWAQGAGVPGLPRPLARDAETHTALYTFVPGNRFAAGEVTADHVRQALDLVLKLNSREAHAKPAPTVTGSEAAFSGVEHMAIVDRRLNRLGAVSAASAVEKDMQRFVKESALPAWAAVKADVLSGLANLRVDPAAAIPTATRVLSPSDFGFHNALLEGNAVCFVDFEYAGWDDPAKLLGDFFNQVAVPVPMTHFAAMRERLAGRQPDQDRESRRLSVLFPVYVMKWISIILNEFVPDSAKRRSYAEGDQAEARKDEQLQRARAKLASLPDIKAEISR